MSNTETDTDPNGQPEKPSNAAALALYVPSDENRGTVYGDPAAFAHFQRVAYMFSQSELVPAHFRGKVSDCLIAVELSQRMAIPAMQVFQNLIVVKGNPGWKSQFMIALVQQRGWETDWEIEELEPAKLGKFDNMRCRFIMERRDKRRVGPWVSMAQAIAATWTKNEQYDHSPELMLRYRSAAFAIRLYAPAVLQGLPTADEIETLVVESVEPAAATPRPTRGTAAIDAVIAQPAKLRGAAAMDADLADHAASVADAIGPSPQTDAGLSAAGAAGDEEPPRAAGDRNPQPADPELDARALLRILKEHQLTGRVLSSVFQPPLKDTLGLRRLDGKRLTDAVQHGARAGWWEPILDEGGRTLAVFVASEPAARAVEELPPEPSQAGPSDPRAAVIARASQLEKDVGADEWQEARNVCRVEIAAPLVAVSTDLLLKYVSTLEQVLADIGGEA